MSEKPMTKPEPSAEPVSEGVDPFGQAARQALEADPFLRAQVDAALGGLRSLLPERGRAAAEELLVELFIEDPIASGYLERLRPVTPPTATTERDLRSPADQVDAAVPSRIAGGGRR
jgi:hypothetical protein